MSMAVLKLTLIMRVKGEDGCGGVFVDVALSYLTSLPSPGLRRLKMKLLPFCCSVSHGETTIHRNKLALLTPPANVSC